MVKNGIIDNMPGEETQPTGKIDLAQEMANLKAEFGDLIGKLPLRDRQEIISSMSERIAEAVASTVISQQQMLPEIIKIVRATVEFLKQDPRIQQ